MDLKFFLIKLIHCKSHDTPSLSRDRVGDGVDYLIR